ncbi:MAG TPA: hypothetical protein VK404_10330 [Spirosoma sp.]|nr:hypothetical protein [Spirosoma sp.]
MAGQAKYTYLLCDLSKFKTEKYVYFAPVSLIDSQFDVLITDNDAPSDVVADYRQAGVTVMN